VAISVCGRKVTGLHDLAIIIVSTNEGHVAAVEILALPGVGNSELRLAYTVWR